MKRIVSFILAGMVLVSLAGCSLRPQAPYKDPVEEVILEIDLIGYVSETSLFQPLERESAIVRAGNMYDQLTEEQKARVTNADKLNTARIYLQKAKDLKKIAQTFTEKLFCRFARCFRHSETIRLKRAWFYSMDGETGHRFTFEFEIKNEYGNTETCIYGTTLSFTDMSDQIISERVGHFSMYGDTRYFAEGETFAMDHGIALDAPAIQRYFEQNRNR